MQEYDRIIKAEWSLFVNKSVTDGECHATQFVNEDVIYIVLTSSHEIFFRLIESKIKTIWYFILQYNKSAMNSFARIDYSFF